MKTITGKIFTVKVSVEREKDGVWKNVKEEYACRAVSFTDCEAKITRAISEYSSQGHTVFDILSEAIAPYKEVYIFDEGDIFYKVKIQEIDIDDNGREKKTFSHYLLNATSFEQARKNIVEALSGLMTDYTIAAVIEQKILEVFA